MDGTDKVYRFNHVAYLTLHDIVSIYERIEADGLSKFLFYGGGVRNSLQFYYFIKPPHPCWLVRCEEEDGTPVGVWWLNEFQGRTAMLHFSLYKSNTEAEKLAICRQSMEWLAGLGALDSLYGLTPVVYRHVWKCMDHIGFERVGKLKGACHMFYYNKYVDGVISTLDLSLHKGAGNGTK